MCHECTIVAANSVETALPDLSILLSELRDLATDVGLEVSFVPLDTDGGLVKLGEKRKVFISSVAPLTHQVDVLVSALRTLDLSDRFVLPRVREALDAAG